MLALFFLNSGSIWGCLGLHFGLIFTNPPSIQATKVGTAECAERLNPPHPCRRDRCLTKACMQTPAQTPAKTWRVMHANATLPPLPPAPRIAPTCASFRFFFAFFRIANFLAKKRARKSQKSPIWDFWPPGRAEKKIKSRKSSKMGSPGPRFWVFFEPRFANLKTFKFAAMRSVS